MKGLTAQARPTLIEKSVEKTSSCLYEASRLAGRRSSLSAGHMAATASSEADLHMYGADL